MAVIGGIDARARLGGDVLLEEEIIGKTYFVKFYFMYSNTSPWLLLISFGCLLFVKEVPLKKLWKPLEIYIFTKTYLHSKS